MFAAACVARAVSVPVTVDAEGGYGLAPRELVDRLLETGAVGCHMAPSELRSVIAGLARVLVPGGRLAFVLHVGEEVRHLDELFGTPVDLDFVLHDAAEVRDAVAAAGLVDIEW